MIPILQTILADPDRDDGHSADGEAGNCYQAALASALDLPLDAVPHFAAMGADWWPKSHDWLAANGLIRLIWCDDHDTYPSVSEAPWPMSLDCLAWPDDLPAPRELVAVLGCGPSPRGAFRHVVLLDPASGSLLHDPHPSGDGVKHVDELEVLVRIEDHADVLLDITNRKEALP